VVLSQKEVQRLLAAMDGRPGVIAALLYGTGMRLMECLRLRVKDVDFARNEITVREGKGGKDRRTVLPKSLVEPLQREIARARVLHEADLTAGFGEARLPFALTRKYPRAGRDFGWQFVFPSTKRSRDPLDGTIRRHHFDEAILARAMKRARGVESTGSLRLSEFTQYGVRRNVTRGPRNPAARVRAGATQVQAINRCFVPCPACHRAHDEQLVQADIAVEDVAFGDAEAAFQVERGNHIPAHNRCRYIRCVFSDDFNHAVTESFALFIPGAAGQVVRHILHKAGEDVVAGGGEIGIYGGGFYAVYPPVVGDFSILRCVVAGLRCREGGDQGVEHFL
jgi:hypothetical protein